MHRTLTSTGAFAVSAMIDLALMSKSSPVSLTVLGEHQKISKSYLDQLFGRLRRRGLVRSTRGPGGGYSLGREAHLISVADIVLAVDKPWDATVRDRKARSGPEGSGYRSAHNLWNELNLKLVDWLGAISLEAVIGERLARNAAAAQVAKTVPMGQAPRLPPLPPVPRPVGGNVPNSVFALGHSLSAHAQWVP